MIASAFPSVVAAPMAGGASTPGLVAAVSGAGGLGFLAAGYKTAGALADEIAAVRRLTDAAFGVNLFVPWFPIHGLSAAELDARALSVTNYASMISGESNQLGATLGVPRPFDDDCWSEKIEVIVAARCPVVSFTFGTPPPEVTEPLRSAGCLIVVTVTSTEEAGTASSADVLCVQGPEAGGHRGTHDPARSPGEEPLLHLVRELRSLGTPMVAAGGITRRSHVRAAFDAGASSVQCGTLFIRSPESGASVLHKSALAAEWADRTVVTRAFSGRFARGLENLFIRAHDAAAPAAYPELNQLTQPMRAAAARVGDVDHMALWAGTGYRDADDVPAGEIVALVQSWCPQRF